MLVTLIAYLLYYLLVPTAIYFAFYYTRWHFAKPEFKGKRVLITGACSGIGEQLAKHFTVMGAAKVWLVSNRREELKRVAGLCQELAKKHGTTVETNCCTLDLNEEAKCL
jgi:short-subunit dehydrogenase